MKRITLLMFIAMIVFAASRGIADERERSESAERVAAERIRHAEEHSEGRESAEARYHRELREKERHTEAQHAEHAEHEHREQKEKEGQESAEARYHRELREEERQTETEHAEEEYRKGDEDREISQTRQAKRLLKISYDQDMLPLEPEIVDNLIRGASIRAARQMDFLKFDIQQNCIMAYRDYLLYNFEIDISPEAEPVAQELMHTIINHLRESLEITFHQHLEEKELRMQRANEKCMHAENQIREIQHQTREIAANSPVNRDQLQGIIQDLTHEIHKSEMEMASSEHLIKELSEQIHKARYGAEERLETDPVMKELRDIIATSEKNLHIVEKQVEAGQQPMDKLHQAKENLIKARVEIARRHEELVGHHGGQKANILAERKTDLTMKMSQMRIRKEAALRQLEETRKKLGRADDYEILSIKIEMAKEKLAHALEIKNDMELSDLQPPRVYVIGGD